jgi:hypothetical protein
MRENVINPQEAAAGGAVHDRDTPTEEDHMGAHEKKRDWRVRSKHWLEAAAAWAGMVLAGLVVFSPNNWYWK